MARKWRLVGILLILLALGLAACSREPETAVAPDTLTDLTAVTELQDAFNGDVGQPRLLLILAPT